MAHCFASSASARCPRPGWLVKAMAQFKIGRSSRSTGGRSISTQRSIFPTSPASAATKRRPLTAAHRRAGSPSDRARGIRRTVGAAGRTRKPPFRNANGSSVSHPLRQAQEVDQAVEETAPRRGTVAGLDYGWSKRGSGGRTLRPSTVGRGSTRRRHEKATIGPPAAAAVTAPAAAPASKEAQR